MNNNNNLLLNKIQHNKFRPGKPLPGLFRQHCCLHEAKNLKYRLNLQVYCKTHFHA